MYMYRNLFTSYNELEFTHLQVFEHTFILTYAHYPIFSHFINLSSPTESNVGQL